MIEEEEEEENKIGPKQSKAIVWAEPRMGVRVWWPWPWCVSEWERARRRRLWFH